MNLPLSGGLDSLTREPLPTKEGASSSWERCKTGI